MDHVFVVQHERQLAGERDEVKFIGVYGSRQDAEAAVERLKRQPGFREYPDGFHVDQYEVGKDHWTEGFVGIMPGDE
jgi:hypothetical protein